MLDDPTRARLDDLRAQLAAIDREILGAAARRQALAQQIGQVKRAAGIPTRDYRQERDVIERARTAAAEHGLAPALGEEVMLALIRSSLTIQEKDQVAAHGEGSGRRVLVIGGRGNMGRWLVRFLASQGFSVATSDPAGAVDGFPHHPDWKAAVREHEIVAVAAPMPATNQIL